MSYMLSTYWQQTFMFHVYLCFFFTPFFYNAVRKWLGNEESQILERDNEDQRH